jgi:hypothetical protein
MAPGIFTATRCSDHTRNHNPTQTTTPNDNDNTAAAKHHHTALSASTIARNTQAHHQPSKTRTDSRLRRPSLNWAQ